MQRYASYCIPITWTDTVPKQMEIFDINEKGNPVVLDVPWFKKKQIFDIVYDIKNLKRHSHPGLIKDYCRIMYNFKKDLERLPRK